MLRHKSVNQLYNKTHVCKICVCILNIDDSSIGDNSNNSQIQNNDTIDEPNGEKLPIRSPLHETKYDMDSPSKRNCKSNIDSSCSSSLDMQSHHGDTLTDIGEGEDSHVSITHEKNM